MVMWIGRDMDGDVDDWGWLGMGRDGARWSGRSCGHVLHEDDVGIDAFDEGGIGGGVCEVGLQHLLSFHFESFEFVALGEVLLLRVGLDEVVDAIEAVLDLSEVGLDIFAVGEGGSGLANRLELESISFPVIIVKVIDELFALFVVEFGSIEVLGVVAGDHV